MSFSSISSQEAHTHTHIEATTEDFTVRGGDLYGSVVVGEGHGVCPGQEGSYLEHKG